MKKTISNTVKIAALAMAASLTFAGCSKGKDALVIQKQGVFTSGGSVTEPVAGRYAPEKSWLDQTRAGNTAHIDHANTFYQIPAGKTKNPIVYLHGYGQSRTGWQTTPDGREGWSDIFLRKGYPAFLVDQAWYTHFRIGLVSPERYEGSAFPAGEEAQNQFFRQMTPNTGDYDEKLFGEVLSEVLADTWTMTGKKSIYITHSQGGRVGWQTDTENMAAIVAIEPGGTPVVGSEEYKKFLAAKIPMVIYFGDYIDNGPENIMSTGFWKNVRDTAIDFAEHYNADGGDATVVDLPKAGITGNSHFMFQETNNREIADHIEKWLKERGL